MHDSAIRVLKLTGFGSACIVLGLYVGMNRAYDIVGAQAVAVIEAAGCGAETASPLAESKETADHSAWY